MIAERVIPLTGSNPVLYTFHPLKRRIGNTLKRTNREMISDVRNIDCMIGMKEYPDKYFDLAIVDPPYFAGPNRRGFYGQRTSSIGVRRRDYPKTNHWQIPNCEYFKELVRVSVNQIVWGANHFISQFPIDSSCWIIWDKVNDSSDFADAELAWTSFDKSARMFRFMWNGMLQGSLEDGSKMEGNKALNEKRIHPTQKPVQLYKWLLKNYAKPGDKILDTHLGSGSSRIAAYDMGFDFTAFEIDKDYFEAQEKRFNQHKSQLKLFTNASTNQH